MLQCSNLSEKKVLKTVKFKTIQLYAPKFKSKIKLDIQETSFIVCLI